jgi:serine/threonine-protein kinase
MGVVYRARHLRLNRTVALKMLLAGAYAGPQERARFQREAEVVAGLRPANIVQRRSPTAAKPRIGSA